MPNVLQNVLKTKGLNNEQPWKSYYKGIKVSNPLGGNIRRMGNKVKSVLPSTTTKTLTFSFMDMPLAYFRASQKVVLTEPEQEEQPTDEELRKWWLQQAELRRKQALEVQKAVQTTVNAAKETRGWLSLLGLRGR